jgi:TRAP-type C4-dicarboxylate transport system permease small subunit
MKEAGVQRILRVFDRLINLMTFLAGLILLFIMLSVCLEVILRYFFNRPLVWVIEVTECLLLYLTFLASAWLLREEGHVKIDILLGYFGARSQAFLGVVSSLIGVVVSLVLTIYGAGVTWDYFQRGIYTPTAMEIPVSAIILIIPLGGFMLLVQFCRRSVNYFAGFFIESGRSKP